MTTTVVYDAEVRPDEDAGCGYMAVSMARSIGTVTRTDWDWTGYGSTPEEAIARLERRLGELHQAPCRPRRIVYYLAPHTQHSCDDLEGD